MFFLCYQPEQRVDDLVLREDIPLGKSLELAFAEPRHRLIALDRPLGREERPTPSARGDAACDKAIIPFHHVMEVFALPQQTRRRQGFVLL